MSACSSFGEADEHPKKSGCPVNGRGCLEVSERTILHHIKDEWHGRLTSSRYFFCDDPECDVVYFGEDGSTILKSQLRTRIGLKENSPEALLCYCFGVRKGDLHEYPSLRAFVVAQTKAGLCSCDTSNPSGRCCLKDFPK